MKVRLKICIKFDVNKDYDDPSSELLNKLVEDVNNHLPLQERLSNPVINGKYVNFDYVRIEHYDSTEYVSGMVAGYLLANGFEIL